MHQQNDRYKIDSERTQRNRLATQHSTRADMNFISPQRAANNQIHSKIHEKRNTYIYTQEKIKLRHNTKVLEIKTSKEIRNT